MAADQDEKTEEPTQRRLQDARKRGEIIYSTEAGAWLMLAAGALALSGAGPVAASLARSLTAFLTAPQDMPVDGRGLIVLWGEIGMRVGGALGLSALALAAAAFLARYVQDAPTLSFSRLKPDPQRLNPVKNFSRVLGPQAFGNFGKGIVKFVVVGGAVIWALWPRDATLSLAPLLDVAALWPLIKERAMSVLGACLVAFGLLAIVDFVMTRRSYMKRMRMTRAELRDEHRQSEGDPHVRARLRQIRMERGRNRMMAEVPKATVVVMNPTHYAVALRYEQGETAAPICVAKGVDETALRIRAVAEEARVPVVEDPPLARALFASADLDAPIPHQHYEAVAKVIGYVLRLADRRRTLRRGPNRS